MKRFIKAWPHSITMFLSLSFIRSRAAFFALFFSSLNDEEFFCIPTNQANLEIKNHLDGFKRRKGILSIDRLNSQNNGLVRMGNIGENKYSAVLIARGKVDENIF